VFGLFVTFTKTNHFPEDPVRYIGSRTMIEEITKRRFLRSNFVVVLGILRMETMLVWARKLFLMI